MPDAGRLRETTGQLLSRAHWATQAALRERFLVLAEYYDEMAADIEPQAPIAAALPW
jgi:hypothetical protein